MKKAVSVLLALTVILSIFIFPVTAGGSPVKKITMLRYKYLNLTFKATGDSLHDCKIADNKEGFLKIDAYDEGDYYWITVTSLKPTGKHKPKITVTDRKTGSVVKSYEFTVKPAKKVGMSDVKLNVNTLKKKTIANPYIKSYKFKYNKKILSLKTAFSYDGREVLELKGLKKGTATVKAVIDGKVYGSFKVTVGNFKAVVKSGYRKRTLKYNKHVKSYQFYSGGAIDLSDALNYYRSDAVYSVRIENEKIAAFRKRGADKENLLPERAEIYALKPGKTNVTVYEKRGKTAKKKIGTIALTVKKAKDSEAFEAIMMDDNDGIFYEFRVVPGDKVNFKKIIADRYLGRFAKSEYKITVKAGPAGILETDKDGNIICKGLGINRVEYKIAFKDGSAVEDAGSLETVDEDFYG